MNLQVRASHGNLMASLQPANCGGHRHYASGDMIFEWLEGKIHHGLALISNYCLSLKDMARKHTTYEINKSDPGHRCLKQQSETDLKITFTSLSKKGDEKKK